VGPSPPEEADLALDTLAEVLRTLGEFPIPLEGEEPEALRATHEAWSRHLLVRAPRTGSPAGEDATASPRDWSGVNRFVRERRSRESEAVQTTHTDLRHVIWTFIRGLAAASAEEQAGESELQAQSERLRGAVALNSTEAIKREATSAIDLISRVTEARKQRQRAQVEELGTRLRSTRLELHETRQRMLLDPLTQLFKRAAFDEEITRIVDPGLFYEQSACLLFADVDHLKWINDRFSHAAGAAALRRLAACLQRSFLRKDDFVSRYGGEEFTILIRESSLETASRLAERLLAAVRELAIEHEGHTLQVTLSLGLARLAPGERANVWVERADRALYRAKEGGRDRLEIEP